MPKQKTNRGAMKRFKISKHGKVRFRRAFRNHGLIKRNGKWKRAAGRMGSLSLSDVKLVFRLLKKV